MKTLWSILLSAVLLLGLANCGKDSDFTPGPATVATGQEQEIEFDDNGDVITWTELSNNLFTSANDCPSNKGLNSDADADETRQYLAELRELIGTSTVGKGTQANRDSDSIYLTIRYKDGSRRVFNLRTDLASTTIAVGVAVNQLAHAI